jgi:hypothetical protein
MITNPHKFKTLEFGKPRRILPSSDLQVLKTYKNKMPVRRASNKMVHERSYWYRRRATKQKMLTRIADPELSSSNSSRSSHLSQEAKTISQILGRSEPSSPPVHQSGWMMTG